jgi:chromosome segregation ATPase
MSQSETYMLIALGFAIATLAALVVGRMAWKLALRLGAKRAMRNIPSTVVELQTDRDRLRADHAMMAAKLEADRQDMKMRLAEQAAEVSRHRNRVERVSQEYAKKDGEIAALREKINSLRDELAASAKEIKLLRFNVTAKEADLFALKNPEAAREAAQPSDETQTQYRLQNRITELTSLSAQMSRQREDAKDDGLKVLNGILVKPANSVVFESEAKPEKAATTEHSAEQLQSELQRLDEAWSIHEPETQSAPTEQSRARRGITNVISLAQRIKALQKSISE